VWTRWEIEGLQWVATIAIWHEDRDLSSRPEHVRLVVAEMPRWALDPHAVATLRDIAAALRPPPPVTLVDFDRSIVPLLCDALETGRLVVLDFKDNGLPAPPIGPGPGPKKPSTIPPKGKDLTWFEIRVTDEIGDPVAEIDLTITLLRGKVFTKKTDANGKVRIEDVDDSTAEARLKDIVLVRDKLRPRWQKPRTPKIPTGSNVVTRQLADTMEPVALENEVPTTLVLLPRFRCDEIPGARFDFGRSFVLPAALSELGRISEDLQQDDGQQGAIFGHTDLSGIETQNKGLSERRAKALYALLTQDSDLWEKMWKGAGDTNWFETWGMREVQIMLNALSCTAKDGLPIPETGAWDIRTDQAIRKFQRGEYPDKPAEQAALNDDGDPGPATRKELFLAYAKKIQRKPVDKARFFPIGASPFMGCGQYNPLSTTAKDAQSRRAVLFVFDPAAAPQNAPCKIGDIKPCKALLSDPKPEDTPALPYKCSFYRDIAKGCPCQGGADLLHDVLLRFPMTLADAGKLPHQLILEGFRPDNTADGATPDFTQTKALKSDARAIEQGFVELAYLHLPESFLYRLRAEGDGDPYEVFGLTRYPDLSELSKPLGAQLFPTVNEILTRPPKKFEL